MRGGPRPLFSSWLIYFAAMVAALLVPTNVGAQSAVFNADDLQAFKSLSESLHRSTWRDCNDTTTNDPCSVCSSNTDQHAVICETFAYNVTVNSSTTLSPTLAPSSNLRRRELAIETRYETRIIGLRFRNLGIVGQVPVLALSSFNYLRQVDFSNDRSAPYYNLINSQEECVYIPRCYRQVAQCNMTTLTNLCTPPVYGMSPGAFAGMIIGITLVVLAAILLVSNIVNRRYLEPSLEEIAAKRAAKQAKKNKSISQRKRKQMEKERAKQEKQQQRMAAAKQKAQNGGANIVSSGKPKKHQRDINDMASQASFRSSNSKRNLQNANTGQSTSRLNRSASFRSTKSKKSRAGGMEKQKSVYSSMRTRIAKSDGSSPARGAFIPAVNPWSERMDTNGTRYWVNTITGVTSATPPRDAFSNYSRDGASSGGGGRSLRNQMLQRPNSSNQSSAYDDLDEPNYTNAPMFSAPGGFGGGVSHNPMFQGGAMPQGSMDPRTGQFVYH